jgi:hypothetical protein
MSQHKFASNVVEKLLQLSDSETRTMILNEITGMRQHLYFCTSSKKSTNTDSETRTMIFNEITGMRQYSYFCTSSKKSTNTDSETRTMILNEITGMSQYSYFCTSKQVCCTSKKKYKCSLCLKLMLLR